MYNLGIHDICNKIEPHGNGSLFRVNGKITYANSLLKLCDGEQDISN